MFYQLGAQALGQSGLEIDLFAEQAVDSKAKSKAIPVAFKVYVASP